jgi:hypothetical protein
LAILDRGEATLGYSLTSVGTMIGLGSGGARALALVVGTGFLGAVVWTRRDDRLSFAIAALAAVALSPVVWLQYFIFILIPLALAAPRLTSFWLIVPAIYWIAPGEVRSPLHLATAWAAAGLALTAIPWVRLRAGAPEGPTPQALLARRRVRS